jgi:ubiquinone/menaquinone biosynthesis C-methylase UbiE
MKDRNEQYVAAAFSRQSGIFDQSFSGNSIIQYKRKRVRDLVSAWLPPHSKILELNSGTGEDAVWFAGQGHQVHATDISPGMLQVLQEKVALRGLQNKITAECCSFTDLQALKNKGPYDLVFSNFAGLNCTGEINRVLLHFERLLNPSGFVILVMMPGFCLWETALLFSGKFRTACRRLFSKKGVKARVEGIPFTCWYHQPTTIISALKNNFRLLDLEGLCSLVPPSYLEHFPEKHPALYRFLAKSEDRLKSKWPWKFIGDYYILVLQKKKG